MATTLNGFLKNLREKTGSTSLKESRYGDAESWISTGSLALNRIISGSMKKGIPSRTSNCHWGSKQYPVSRSSLH